MAGRQVAFGVLMALFTLCASCNAETDTNGNQEHKSVTIPLDQIWAYRMPGTRDIRELQTDRLPPVTDGHLVAQIRRSLSKRPPRGKKAKAGFAVIGTGMEALREAHLVLVKSKKPRPTFPARSEISLVFFSHQAGSYVHLHEVEQHDGSIEVRYRFVPHETREATEHISLIPLGQLPAGKVEVKIVRSPMEKKFVELGFKPLSKSVDGKTVCKSFSFEIENPSEEVD